MHPTIEALSAVVSQQKVVNLTSKKSALAHMYDDESAAVIYAIVRKLKIEHAVYKALVPTMDCYSSVQTSDMVAECLAEVREGPLSCVGSTIYFGHHVYLIQSQKLHIAAEILVTTLYSHQRDILVVC